jgi:ubiquinone/menaquinone biosynthesis C-methylase UbiE
MQVLVLGSASAGFLIKAAERTAPDGKVLVFSPDGKATRRLEKRLAPLGFDHLVLETSPAGQVPLPDRSIDRVLLVMGMRKIPSLERNMAEACRVLKPEGQFVIHRRSIFAGLLPRQWIVSSCADTGLDLVASHSALSHHTLTLEKRNNKDLTQTD